MKIFFQYFIIYLLFAFAIINSGFSTIGIFGIPIFPFLSIVTVILLPLFYPKSFIDIPKEIQLSAFLLIIYSFIIFISSLFNGYSFLRTVQDFEIILDMSFILMGFFLAKQLKSDKIQSLFTYLFISCFFSAIIIFLVGKDTIYSLSPTVGIYKNYYLLGNTAGYFYLLGIGAFYFLYTRPLIRFNSIVATLLLIMSLMPQKRFSIIILMIFICHYLFFTSSKNKFQILRIIPFFIMAIFILSILNIQGERGVFSFSFLAELYSSIFLIDLNDGNLSGGIFYRFNLIADSLSKLQNWNDLLFGIGFGEPITNRINLITGLTVRTSHIFILDILVRTGFFGLILVTNFFYRIIKHISCSYNQNVTSNWLFISILICLICAQTNPLLSYIHMSLPIYIFIGISLYLNKKDN